MTQTMQEVISQHRLNIEGLLDKAYARWEVKEEIKTRCYEAILHKNIAYIDKDLADYCPDDGYKLVGYRSREANEAYLKSLGIWQYVESQIKD